MPSGRGPLYAAGFLALLNGHSWAEEGCGARFCSKTFMVAGACTGTDHVAIVEGPWEPSPIAIRGVTVGLLTHPPTGMAYAFAGNNTVPDVMALQIGHGSSTVMYPEGRSFGLPAEGQPGHVDLHVQCLPQLPQPSPRWFLSRWLLNFFPPTGDRGAANFQAWLVVFYELSPK